jgi:GTPase SAR1 family protein
MKIGILAPEESGKTSFITALYGVLDDKNTNNKYPLRYEFTDKKQKSDLAKAFTKLLSTDIGNERFPRGNVVITDYKLTVSHIDDPDDTINLSFLDYPGGLVRSYVDEDDDDASNKFSEYITQCDAYIILIDIHRLLAPAKDYVVKNKTAVSDITKFLDKASRNSGEFKRFGI